MSELPRFSCIAPSGPPLNVTFTSRGKHWLELSWKAPDQRWNGEEKGYQVCHSVQENSSNPSCSELTNSLSYTISQLLSSTKYFVTVSAATNAGVGPRSLEVSKMTNGGKYTSYYFYIWWKECNRIGVWSGFSLARLKGFKG
jgi:hypothetical protein